MIRRTLLAGAFAVLCGACASSSPTVLGPPTRSTLGTPSTSSSSPRSTPISVLNTGVSKPAGLEVDTRAAGIGSGPLPARATNALMVAASGTPAPMVGGTGPTSRDTSTSSVKADVKGTPSGESKVERAPVQGGPKVLWTAAEEPAQTTRRALFRFKDEKAAKEFTDIVSSKRQATQDIEVFRRLLTEKAGERQALMTALADEFGVEADKDYEYDANALTIYRLASGSNSTARTVHRELKDKAKGDVFARRAVSRRLINLTIDVLTLLIREKDLEVLQCDQSLSERFSIVSSRTYQYDPATLTLYETLTVPGGAIPPAESAVLPVRK